jgi:hypothetical protein
VTVVVVTILALIVAIDAFSTPQRDARRDQPANQLAPLTSATELRDTGNRALALVNFPWHDLGYEIVFAPAQPGVRAQTDVVAHRITVFLAKGDAAHRVAHDIGHELGHAYDARYLSEADRAAYLVVRGKPKANWFPGTKFSDYDTGAGDFAEVFASCHAASPEFRSRLAPRPAQPCSLIPTPRAGVK